MQTTVNYAVLGLLDTVSAERITLLVVSCCVSTSPPPVSLLGASFRSDSWSYCCIFRRIHTTTSLKSIRDASCTLRVPTLPWLGLKPRPPPPFNAFVHRIMSLFTRRAMVYLGKTLNLETTQIITKLIFEQRLLSFTINFPSERTFLQGSIFWKMLFILWKSF